LVPGVDAGAQVQRLDLRAAQPRLRARLVHVCLLDPHLRLDRLAGDRQALLLDVLAVLELLGRALRELERDVGDQPVLVELFVGVGPQPGLPRLGRDARGRGPLVEQLALQPHLELGVARLCGAYLRLGVLRLRQQLGVAELEDHRVGLDDRAREQDPPLDARLGERWNPADVLGHERPEAAHFAHHLAALHRVDHDCRPLDGRGRRLEARDAEREEYDRRCADSGPDQAPLLLLLEEVRPCDVHATPLLKGRARAGGPGKRMSVSHLRRSALPGTGL
jgi:hypothetical protein